MDRQIDGRMSDKKERGERDNTNEKEKKFYMKNKTDYNKEYK